MTKYIKKIIFLSFCFFLLFIIDGVSAASEGIGIKIYSTSNYNTIFLLIQ